MAQKETARDRAKYIVTSFAREIFGEMLRHSRDKYQIPDFDPCFKLCFRKTRMYSWGGMIEDRPFINIAAFHVLWMVPNKKAVRSFFEYDYLKYLDDIGPFTGNWKAWIAATIAHEMAHAIHWFIEEGPGKHALEMFPEDVRKDGDDHGRLWQALYRDLRRTFVNGVDFSLDYNARVADHVLRGYKRGFELVERNAAGGRFVEYKRDGKSAGVLFKKHGCKVALYDEAKETFVATDFDKLVDARRHLLSMLQ